MTDERDSALSTSDLPELIGKIRARTPARLLVGRAGAAYRTNTQLDLREAHAAARDAVQTELNLNDIFGSTFVERWGLFEVHTKANFKEQYLLRPDLGRHFNDSSRTEIRNRCYRDMDFQIVLGDGLSVPALAAQVPTLLPLLCEGAKQRGWKIGQTFVIHHCRVGILNETGQLLNPDVAVLLIGERPGLASAESLSAYMAFRPNDQHTDANRNVISNIHARGLNPEEATARILNLAKHMKMTRLSGCMLNGELHEPKDQ